MKKLLFTLLFAAFFIISAYSQNYMGIANSNFGGTNALYFNPASIADSRNIIYLNLLAPNFSATNNYLEYKAPFTPFQVFTNNVPSKYLDSTGNISLDTIYNYITENPKSIGKSKNMSLTSEWRGPSLLVSINRKNSVALTSRVKGAFQLYGVNEEIIKFIHYFVDTLSMDYKDLLFEEYIPAAKFNINVNAYSETGLSYARVLYEKQKHFLKGGLSVKKLAGLGSFFLLNNNLSIKFHVPYNILNFDSLGVSLADLDLQYGYISNEYYTKSGAKDIFLINPVGKGWGFDFGFIYEFRPNYDKFQYRMNNKDKIDNSKNKYRYRLGVSLMDIGSIKYDNPKYVRRNTLDKNSKVFAILDTVQWNSMGDTMKNVKNMEDFDKSIDQMIGISKQEKSFTTKLPSTINLMGEARFFNHFILNVSLIQALRNKESIGIRQSSSLAITPRIEYKWIEASIPFLLTYDYTKLQIGGMLRLGPLFIGSDNMGGLFGLTAINGFDFYAGLSIPICKGKLHDKDKDGVSNWKDKCKKVPGVWAFKGCPDTDNDSIPDSKDKCPTKWGIKAFEGCPDTDNDKIPDDLDECPNTAGVKEMNGCPDADGDGIKDKLDSCPDIKGLAFLHGCPDADGDSVPDKQDPCPDVKGSKENNGCSDTDGDGLLDNEDECPTQFGPKEAHGCRDDDKDGVPNSKDKCPDQAGPPQFDGCPDTDNDGFLDKEDDCPNETGLAVYFGCPDRDLDGVPDKYDNCPDTYGTKENKGCPLVKVQETVQLAQLTKEEQVALKTAFEDLSFETGKMVISEKSLAALDTLALVLLKKPEYKLYISGHTDNVGSVAANKKLSENRAKSVKDYIVSKGVETERITIEGFGPNRPVASNTTPEGKQKNRRVELKVIK